MSEYNYKIELECNNCCTLLSFYCYPDIKLVKEFAINWQLEKEGAVCPKCLRDKKFDRVKFNLQLQGLCTGTLVDVDQDIFSLSMFNGSKMPLTGVIVDPPQGWIDRSDVIPVEFANGSVIAIPIRALSVIEE